MSDRTPFQRVPPEVSFPEQEHTILELWDRVDAFAVSVSSRPADREFTFYDGPPFPTGSPHYGNLLAGVLKDIVPRYWTMRGHRVVRRFGWDTHGLPIGFRSAARTRTLQSIGDRRLRRRTIQRGMPKPGHGKYRGLGEHHAADRSVGRLRGRLQDHGSGLHGVGLVGVQAPLGSGPGLQGVQGPPLLLRSRDSALQ